MENKSNFWSSYRILFKSALIGALILLLLIPTTFIQNLVSERQQRQQEAVAEISSRWAAPQTICGPVIGIPYYDVATDNGNRQVIKRWAYFLPGKLNIRSRLVPEKRPRHPPPQAPSPPTSTWPPAVAQPTSSKRRSPPRSPTGCRQRQAVPSNFPPI